jgi:hypothetical protein
VNERLSYAVVPKQSSSRWPEAALVAPRDAHFSRPNKLPARARGNNFGHFICGSRCGVSIPSSESRLKLLTQVDLDLDGELVLTGQRRSVSEDSHRFLAETRADLPAPAPLPSARTSAGQRLHPFGTGHSS